MAVNRPALTLFFNVALVALIGLVLFRHQPGLLFLGNDGPTFVALAKEQLEFFGISSAYHSNLLQGIGNISLPFNLSILPQYWFPLYRDEARPTPWLTFSFFAAQWFLTVWLAGAAYGFSNGIRYAAAWLITLLFFPFLGPVQIYHLPHIAPHIVTLLLSGVLIDISLKKIDGRSWIRTLCWSMLLLAATILALVTNPVTIMLIVPFLCIAVPFSFLRHRNRAALVHKTAVCLALLLLCICMGWFEYVLGMTFYTAAGFFLNELSPSYPPSLEYVSILFQGYRELAAGKPGAGLWLFLGGTGGAILALMTDRARLGFPALMLLIAQALVLITGYLFISLPGWAGPAPVYCEMPFFIFYSLFFIYLVMHLLAKFPYRVHLGIYRRHHIPSRSTPLPMAIVLPALLATGFLLYVIFSPAQVARTGHYAMPPADTPITAVLKKETALTPGSTFRGRTMPIVPDMVFIDQLRYFSSLNHAVGNDMQTTGLWLKNIPTLLEYSQTITPAFYRLVRDFLTVPKDEQNRSWTNFSKLDLPIMRLLGTRFIITTQPGIPGAKERVVYPIPEQNTTLRLFELSQANIAGIAASKVTQVANVEQAVAMMKRKDFDLRNAVVIGNPLEEKWQPVSHSEISVIREGFRIQAKSTGRSLLIVPIEYSHCLEIDAYSGAPPEAIRVNVALTGLIFDKELNVRLVSRIGVFTNPRCRWQDYREFKKLLESA